ncbi:ATP-binding protein [Sporomusa aerivorans]|uniref:sensor histidine kinase n=1 Tax=Sporomusa aerivorans TaxID=204936 RepID=UPI00352BCE6C
MNRLMDSLKTFMTLNIIVAVTLPIIVISVITVTLLNRSMGEQVIRHNTQLSGGLATATQDFLLTADAMMSQAATMVDTGGLNDAQMQNYLDTLMASHLYLEAIHILDNNGLSVFAAPYHHSYATLDFSRQPFVANTRETGRTYWSNTFISQHTGQPTLTVTKPTRHGMVIGYINLSKLNDIAAEGNISPECWTAIVDTEGTFIGHSDRRLVYQRESLGDEELLAAALNEKSGTLTVKNGGREYLVSFTVAQPTGWLVLAAQHTDMAFAPVSGTRNIFIIGCVVALALAVLMAMRILKKIFTPLSELTGETRQVAAGNYNLPLKSYDYIELNELSEHFFAMLEAVRRREEELRRKQRELSRYAQTLRRSNRELDQFAYVVSHDLKAPLRAIANLSQWLEEDFQGTLDADVKRKLELLRGRVRRMESLIEGILEYSRIGRIKTTAELVNVRELIAEVVEDLTVPGGFQIVIGPEMPDVYTERLRLRQVFANLIGNAVKHHDKPAGQVIVTVRDSDGLYEFTVADDGPGIAPEYHRKIFEMFQTLQSRDIKESTGVGLALVKKIVDSQGGWIRILSSAGQGAKFIFAWPKVWREE